MYIKNTQLDEFPLSLIGLPLLRFLRMDQTAGLKLKALPDEFAKYDNPATFLMPSYLCYLILYRTLRIPRFVSGGKYVLLIGLSFYIVVKLIHSKNIPNA